MEKNKGKIKTKNLIVILILGFSVIGVAIFGIVAFSPFGEGKLYISGNDVIKNYNLDSFDGNDIVDGVVTGLDDKLRVEVQAFWIADEEDVEPIPNTILVDGDRVSFQYYITFRSKVNMFTNVRQHQATETDLRVVVEPFFAGSFEHQGLYGHYLDGWTDYLYWHHYDFGDVLDYNFRNNLFSGPLKGSFDINPNPLPTNFTDEDGNLISKQFDYIAVDAMWLDSRTHGKMSTDMPTFVELTPSEFDANEVNDLTGGVGESLTAEGTDWSILWDPDPKFTDPIAIPVETGLEPGSSGVSLYPRNKDGSIPWDPTYAQKSQTDCSFTYNLGALSPLVYEYISTLSYDRQEVIIRDQLIWFEYSTFMYQDDNFAESYTRSVGLHVTNRYVQAEFAVKFKLFSGFQIEMAETTEEDLALPEEYYYELMMAMIVDGFGGGRTSGESPSGLFGEFEGLIIAVIMIAIVGIGLFVVYSIYKKRSQEKFMLQLAGRR